MYQSLSISSTIIIGKSIRIYYECESGIEKSILRITDWHHEACRVMTNVDPEGRIFLYLPQTNNGFFFLLTTKYPILHWNNLKQISRKSWIRWDATWWRKYSDVTDTYTNSCTGPPFSGKLGKPRFPLEGWVLGLGFFCPHWTPMMDSISHIPILNLATVKYCIISVGYVTEVDVYSQWRALYK